MGPPLPTDEGATVEAGTGVVLVGGWFAGEPFEGGVGLLELPGSV